MVVIVSAATTSVLIVNVPVVEPTGTVIDPGMTATASLLERRTSVPPLGAGPLKVTLPSLVAPATTVAGISESSRIVTGEGGLGVVGVRSSQPLTQRRISRTSETSRDRRSSGISG